MVRISVSRNLAEHPFLPAMGPDDFVDVERAMLLALRSLQHSEIAGRYDSLASLDGEQLAQLRGDGLCFAPLDATPGAAALPWGDGSAGGRLAAHPPHYQRGPSGVFRAASGDLAVWVNAADHIQIVGVARGDSGGGGGGGARACFEAVHGALAFLERVLLEQGKSFAQHRRLGYVTACPSLVGTAQLVGVGVQLPALSALGAEAVAEVAAEYGLRCVPVASASSSSASASSSSAAAAIAAAGLPRG